MLLGTPYMPPPYNPHLMIQPNSPPFVHRQFRYVINGKYTGEPFFFIQDGLLVPFIRTDKLSQSHGTWQYCRHVTAIKAFFDFEGRHDNAKLKRVFFRGTAQWRSACEVTMGEHL